MDNLEFDDYLLEMAGVKNTNNDSLVKFAKDRKAGAKSIAGMARAKGGNALLTMYHFNAKIPIYDKVQKSLATKQDLQKEYQTVLTQLRNIKSMQDKKYQELTGQLEALGELILFN